MCMLGEWIDRVVVISTVLTSLYRRLIPAHAGHLSLYNEQTQRHPRSHDVCIVKTCTVYGQPPTSINQLARTCRYDSLHQHQQQRISLEPSEALPLNDHTCRRKISRIPRQRPSQLLTVSLSAYLPPAGMTV